MRRLIKYIITAIFVLIGLALIIAFSIIISKGKDITSEGNYRWVSIINIVFGSIILLSPLILKGAFGLFGSIAKIIVTIIFIVIGAGFIILNAVLLAQHSNALPQWVCIVNIVFGSLLFVSPFFLR